MITEGLVIDTDQRALLPILDEDWLPHFEAHVARLRPVFQRADQVLRFRAYVRGLLEPVGRKNVEAIAAAASQSMVVESDLSQALQHFVSHSPWDSRRLLSALRRQNRARRQDRDAVWVVHDTAFSKKGQHSVGVMRQFARTPGKKINCQLGVFIAQIGPAGYFPLSARLYLPAAWIRENAEGALLGIPEEFRTFASKAEIALSLLEELQAEGETPRPIVAEGGYLADNNFVQRARELRLSLAPERVGWLDSALQRQAWLKAALGLDHFEGRTWHGWHHHVALVLAAYDVLAAENFSGELPPFAPGRAGDLI